MTRELIFHTFNGARVRAASNGNARWLKVEEGVDQVAVFLEVADVERLIAELQALLPKAEGTVECAA